jgi:hypothetical protein
VTVKSYNGDQLDNSRIVITKNVSENIFNLVSRVLKVKEPHSLFEALALLHDYMISRLPEHGCIAFTHLRDRNLALAPSFSRLFVRGEKCRLTLWGRSHVQIHLQQKVCVSGTVHFPFCTFSIATTSRTSLETPPQVAWCNTPASPPCDM